MHISPFNGCVSVGMCTFAHSEVERAFWTAEQKNRIFREDVISELREAIDPVSRSGSVVNGETDSRPSTSMSSNSPKTKNPNQAANVLTAQVQNMKGLSVMNNYQLETFKL